MENSKVICGASYTGKKLEKIILDRFPETKIIYADNFVTSFEGNKIKKIIELTNEHPIYIASHKWFAIYKQLISFLDYRMIKAIYVDGTLIELNIQELDESKNLAEQVKRIVEKKLRIRYCNMQYFEKEQQITQISEKKIQNFLKGKNVIENICAVSIELSNLCNYSMIHPKCPASCQKEKIIMAQKTVFQVLKELAEMQYDGMIQFTAYNEPLIDPRLFMFLQYVRENIPKAYVRIYSNGFYLNQLMVDELIEAGCSILCVTAYGEKEWDRLTSLNVSIPYEVHMCKYPNSLDDRMDIYETCDIVKTDKPCMSLLSFHIHANERIAMCCLDWKAEDYKKYGKISETSIREIFQNMDIVKDISDLLKGHRTHQICKNCGWDIMTP